MNIHLQNYHNNGFWQILGWVDKELLQFFSYLENSGINQTGGIAEIGVHHGRFFYLLNSTVADNHKSYAVDIFEDQHLNVDGSGNGSLGWFLRNKQFDRHKGQNVEVVKGDSTDPTLKLIHKMGRGKIKYFSIDGGHNAQHVMNDLKIAEKTINNQGVVIVDDILHPCWMGVLEGTLEYLRAYPTLVPFSIGCNKLFLCKMSYLPFYLDYVKKYEWHNKQYGRKFFGHDIVPIHV